MNDDASPPESDSSADPIYTSQFRQHLAEVRAHLAGVEGEDLLPSYIPPTGYWTPSEKHTFFHSLSVYSRFRPDLVAACIGTKTVVDVCAYIDTLDEALSQDRCLLRPRSDLEGSMEVSNAWVRREEKMAEELSFVEPKWERNTLLFQREEEVSAKEAFPPAAAPGGEYKDLETWQRDRRRYWSQEDTLSQLGYHHLRIMEGILTESEFGNLEVEEALPEDQRLAGPAPRPFTPPDAQASDRTLHSSVVGDGTIDPTLLRSSRLPVPDRPLQDDLSLQQHLETLLHVDSSLSTFSPCKIASSPPSPTAHVSPRPLFYARSPSPEADQEAAIDPSDLSPASRRRFQKRVYMRRKRAAQTGEEVIAVVAKLRPGRKLKKRKASKSGGKSRTTGPKHLDQGEGAGALMDVDENAEVTALSMSSTQLDTTSQVEEQDDDEDGNSSDASQPRRNKSGLTKPYKIKKGFTSKGINADILITGNLGFFHLSTLSRLMILYKSGYDFKSSDTATSISADTIRLMTAILVEFTTEVVQHTIISREQENKMKGGIKVYHHIHDEISVENVNHVLEMMGMKGLTKEKYFAQLLGEDMPETRMTEGDEELPPSDENTPEDKDEADEDGSNDEDEDVDMDDFPRLEKPTVFPVLPLHREIHPPLVHLPKSLALSAGSGAALVADELLMPMDTDEEELLKELEAEMELDEADITIARAYEADLSKQFGKKI